MKKELLEALNRMAEDNDNGEAEQLAKDYKMLADFISKHSAQ